MSFNLMTLSSMAVTCQEQESATPVAFGKRRVLVEAAESSRA